MIKATLALTAFALVAACGADAPPFRPNATAGVNIGTGGISTNVGVSATNGIINVGVSL